MERNIYGVVAAALTLTIFGALPEKLRRYRQHQAINKEIVDLQTRIVGFQAAADEVQREILAVQQKIRKIQAE